MAEEGKDLLLKLYYEQEDFNKRRTALLKAHAAMDVQDYELQDVDGGSHRLSELFGDFDKMILIHNMGEHCSYCTLWADGLNGQYSYLEKGFDGPAARFILVNNDTPEMIKAFATARGWNFDCYSCRGTTLFEDLGFGNEKDGVKYWHPGYSALTKGADGQLRRVGMDAFGPGDSYCGVWHFYGMLPQAEDAQAN